jgi:hypothetical protein
MGVTGAEVSAACAAAGCVCEEFELKTTTVITTTASTGSSTRFLR